MEIWVGEDIFSPGESDHIKEACVVAVTAKLGPHVSPPKAEQSTRENVYEGDSARKLDQVSLARVYGISVGGFTTLPPLRYPDIVWDAADDGLHRPSAR
eukprot:3150097-Rhodomonas_salina.2